MKTTTQMNKTQTLEFLKDLLANAQFKSKAEQERVLAIIDENFAPKAGGGQVQNPSYYDEELQSQMYYCRYLAQYCTEDEMVMSNGKSKGYSKAAISRWTKAGKEAKQLQEKVLKILLECEQTKSKANKLLEENEGIENIEISTLLELANQLSKEGTNLNAQAEELLIKRNKPEFYEDLRN